jgi:Ca2+-binding RTX toxin-like protein
MRTSAFQFDASDSLVRFPANPQGVINGTPGNDSLTGTSGDDTIDGGAGADTMVGGLGNDTYIVDNVGDVVVEAAGAGTDLVQASVSYTLVSNIENLTLTGTAAINASGNYLNNVLIGNVANNTLNGGAGADTMSGGLGDDVYMVDNVGDVVTEAANAGTDRVQSTISYALGSNLENLTLGGTAAINASGNYLNNVLSGNAANNTLNGGAGADTMSGGLGDDVYMVDNVGDVVTEAANAGTDRVQTTISYTLGANLENLTLGGVAAINGTGNTLNNVITGNAANNTLNGGAGADTMSGGMGDDTYVVDNAADVTNEAANAGTDTVQSSVSWTLGANIENLVLTGTEALVGNGNSLNNVITGNVGNDTLSGGIGADTMAGGPGDDTYVVDNVGDVVVESPDAGTDTVRSTMSYTLGENLENLTTTTWASVAATGNSLDNVINCSVGNDTLDGAGGADTMVGGGGNDTYIVDNTGDVVTELGLGGQLDTVESSVSYTLPIYVEDLILTGSANLTGTGNNSNNLLVGNAGDNVLTDNVGNDTLDGGAGADTMAGGAGNDTYVVDNPGDVIIEGPRGAFDTLDTVQSSISYTLGDYLEYLTLTGTAAINGTGNSLNNVIDGNSANNVLDGSSGVDTLAGGAGDDTYVVDGSYDVVIESLGAGTDMVLSSANYYTLPANVENLTLTGTGAISGAGNGLDNVLVGNAANNSLNGGAGADTMSGGLGDDGYFVDNVGDIVNEAADAGTDTVQATISYTLGDNLENLTLGGTAAINGTGNAVNNLIVGNGNNNVLDGGAGADTLRGGNGNDTLIGGDGSDVLSGGFDAGNDVFVANSLVGSDTITDFYFGKDQFSVSQSHIPVGNGDDVIDGATTIVSAGGFATSAELVIATGDISGAITAASAAAQIGSATDAYAVGQTALFVVDNGQNSAVYYFKSADTNAVVSASELTLLATLQNMHSTDMSNYIFGS